MTGGILLVAAAFSLLPSYAEANAGLPMLAVTWQATIIALVPVVLIEAYVFKRSGFPFGWSLKWNAIANAASRLIGIPLTWGALVVLEMGFARWIAAGGVHPMLNTWPGKVLMVILQSPWLAPWDRGTGAWIVPTAFLILLIPYFLVSWLLEFLVIRGFSDTFDRKAIWKACLRANAVSYTLLALYPASMFGWL